MYFDQSFYLVNSVLSVVCKINNVLQCVDQIQYFEGIGDVDWFVLIVVDVEVGFGGYLNVFELMKVMIDVGVVGVYFEDQFFSVKKCGYMGGKVLVLMSEFVYKFVVVWFVVDVCDVLMIFIVCIDVNSVKFLLSDIDLCDYCFMIGECMYEGFYCIFGGFDVVIDCGLVYVFYVDLLWCEMFEFDFDEVCCFVEVVYEQFLGKKLVYNCLLFFNWKCKFDDVMIVKFQCEFGVMGYKFQFVMLVGFYVLNFLMFDLVCGYSECYMLVYVEF